MASAWLWFQARHDDRSSCVRTVQKTGIPKAIQKPPVRPKMFRNGALHDLRQKRAPRRIIFLDIKICLPPSSVCSIRSLPVRFAHDAMSLTEPGSVAIILSTWPLCKLSMAFGLEDRQRTVQAFTVQLQITCDSAHKNSLLKLLGDCLSCNKNSAHSHLITMLRGSRKVFTDFPAMMIASGVYCGSQVKALSIQRPSERNRNLAKNN